MFLKNLETQEESFLKLDGVFISIGRTSNAEIFKNQLKLNKTGLIEVSKEMQSSVPGVFAVGDVSDALYRKAITASGFGAMAAIEVVKFIENKD